MVKLAQKVKKIEFHLIKMEEIEFEKERKMNGVGGKNETDFMGP